MKCQILFSGKNVINLSSAELFVVSAVKTYIVVLVEQMVEALLCPISPQSTVFVLLLPLSGILWPTLNIEILQSLVIDLKPKS